jgi:hypothetical protein
MERIYPNGIIEEGGSLRLAERVERQNAMFVCLLQSRLIRGIKPEGRINAPGKYART